MFPCLRSTSRSGLFFQGASRLEVPCAQWPGKSRPTLSLLKSPRTHRRATRRNQVHHFQIFRPSTGGTRAPLLLTQPSCSARAIDRRGPLAELFPVRAIVSQSCSRKEPVRRSPTPPRSTDVRSMTSVANLVGDGEVRRAVVRSAGPTRHNGQRPEAQRGATLMASAIRSYLAGAHIAT